MNLMFLAESTEPNAYVPIILPELVVAVAGVVVMVYDSFVPKQRSVTAAISLVGLAIAAVLLGVMWSGSDPTAAGWNGMIVTDSLRLSFSFVFLLVSALTILISTIWIDRENVPAGGYHALMT